MTLTDVVLKPSTIEFIDKYDLEYTFFKEKKPDGESIRCDIPELGLRERIVLNAWGSWEVHHNTKYRRRLGIYSVDSKEDGENPRYVLRKEKEFSEGELARALLSGDFVQIKEEIRGLKYIALGLDGIPIS